MLNIMGASHENMQGIFCKTYFLHCDIISMTMFLSEYSHNLFTNVIQSVFNVMQCILIIY